MRNGIWLTFVALVATDCDCGGRGLSVLTPDIDASPSPLSFGVAYVGFGATKELEIVNRGALKLEVSAIRLSDGTHPGVSVMNQSFSLEPSQTRAVPVVFVPLTVGPAYGSVLIDSDDPDQPVLEIPLEGSAERRPGPAIAVDPLRIDFGTVAFGETREAAIAIRSVGTLPLEVTGAALLAGAHPSIELDPVDFSGTVPVDDTRTITVRFSPQVPEEVNGVVQIRSNDPEVSFVSVIITGSGVAPTLCLSDAILDFGEVAIGDHADRTVTLESCGAVAFDLTALEVLGTSEFTIEMPPSLPVLLDIGQTVEVALRYSPIDGGRDESQLRIRSTLPDGFVVLVGRASSCDLIATPSSINFNAVSAGQSRRRTVLLENAGNADCAVTDLRFGSGTSGEFTMAAVPSLPAALLPATSISIDLDYAPSGPGMDSGTLEIESSDPTDPITIVDLSGRQLGAGECALIATPDPIAFGAVAIGTTAIMNVTIENDGASLCTISNVTLSSASSVDFVLVPPNIPMLVPSGATRTIELHFTPRIAAPQTGDLQVFTGLFPVMPDFFVPISGRGSGPQLCITPDPIIFGTHTIGTPVTRPLQVASCGTEDAVISSVTFPAPTSAEYSLPMPPALPLTIAAGNLVTLDVRYVGVDEGRDDGIIRFVSNDAARPTRDVPMIAHSSNSPCGDVQGHLCGLSGNSPVVGGLVYVDTPSGRVQTTSNGLGDWILTCLPPGTWTVHAEQGSWSTQFSANVQPNSLTSLPGQQCLDPNSADVAVVWGQWDQMEGVLGPLGITYGYYDQMETFTLVDDPAELAQYDIIFFNCGWNELAGLAQPGLQNIVDFVNNGGSIYASDWAYDLVELGWPSYVDFNGDDTQIDAAQYVAQYNGLVDVVDPTLVAALNGRAQVSIIACCTGIDSVGPATTSHLEADRYLDGVDRPFMVSFQPTVSSGKVWYTEFHNIGQPDIQEIFTWLILQL